MSKKTPTLDLAPRDIEITDRKHLEAIGRLWGIAQVSSAFEDAKCTLPGFALARAILDKLLAEARTTMFIEHYKLAAKHDVDLDLAAKFELVEWRTLHITMADEEEG